MPRTRPAPGSRRADSGQQLGKQRLHPANPLARENLCLAGPAGTGKSHVLVALGIAAVQAGHEVRYFTAADLTETLYRGMADNSAGRLIENLLRNDLILLDEAGFAPLNETGAQLLFRFASAACERRAPGWPATLRPTADSRLPHCGDLG